MAFSFSVQTLYKRYLDPNEQYRARVRLEAVALGMHRGKNKRRATPSAEADLEEIDRHLAELSKSDVVFESGALDAASRREDLLSNSGLLLPRSGGRAGFYHLSFQEFLAAVRLRKIGEKPETLLKRYGATPAWHRTLRFLFCALADKDSPEAAIDGFQSLLGHLEPARLDQDPNPALLLADCLEVAHGRGWNLARFAEPLRQACEHALAHLPPPPRAHLWRTLGRIGLDDRPGVGVKNGLPNIDWVEVPAGPFLYGDKKKQKILPTFHIARFPITNAQYQAFIDDSGYETEAWWQGLAERPLLIRGRWNESNHPRETVSWFEAVAFSRWLSARLGYEVRLPTEQEWEKAARGTDGREYPWGDFQPGRANFRKGWFERGPDSLGHTNAVGLYPLGASPYGLMDMAGNVLEWCINKYVNPGKTDTEGNALRVLRGGSWGSPLDLATCTHSDSGYPGTLSAHVGFRLLSVSPIP